VLTGVILFVSRLLRKDRSPIDMTDNNPSAEQPVALSRAEVRSVDERAIRQYGMSSLVLMENAARGIADQLQRLAIDGPVVILCGKGNNGGDGLALARHLDLRGYEVETFVFAMANELSADAAANLKIAQAANLKVRLVPDPLADTSWQAGLSRAAWIVDGLLGTGAQGAVRPPLDSVIERINAAGRPILAIDIPSGMDCDTGAMDNVCVRASHTCTFVAEKLGFLSASAKSRIGTISVHDIGAPRELIESIFAARVQVAPPTPGDRHEPT
jgi:NAD(P)H-hydrate epimerase